MRALKVAVVVMGVLIVLGTVGLVVGIARRSTPPVAAVTAPPSTVSATLEEPAGTRIVGIVGVRNRLAVQLQGGGNDRVLLIDPLTGGVTGRISLGR